jgi:hypothetical protein
MGRLLAWLSCGCAAPPRATESPPLASPPSKSAADNTPLADRGTAVPSSSDAAAASPPRDASSSGGSAGPTTPPPLTAADAADAHHHPHPHRYLLGANGRPVGIANTSAKHDERAPCTVHVTPFEQRVERKMREEEEAMVLCGGRGGGGGDDSCREGAS